MVPFDFHRSPSLSAAAVNLSMATRRLRIVKTAPDFLRVCERCGSQFKSSLPAQSEAENEIAIAFDAHKCLPLDSSQNALRVVREASDKLPIDFRYKYRKKRSQANY